MSLVSSQTRKIVSDFFLAILFLEQWKLIAGFRATDYGRPSVDPASPDLIRKQAFCPRLMAELACLVPKLATNLDQLNPVERLAEAIKTFDLPRFSR